MARFGEGRVMVTDRKDGVTDRKDDDVALLKLELTRLSEACARLKSHPALTQVTGLAAIGIDHASQMMNYANQLDQLFATIRQHAETLKRLADRDIEADALSSAVERTIADLDRTVSPVIGNLRRHAAMLGAQQAGSKAREDQDDTDHDDSGPDGNSRQTASERKLH
jgi:hypothetical protein